MSATKQTDARRRDLARIHLAAKHLDLDDDTYRAMLFTVARVRSAADLDAAGRRRVLAHLRAAGADARPLDARSQPDPVAYAGRPHNIYSSGRGPQIRKIEALLTAADRPWAYADALALRLCKMQRVTWCTPAQLSKIIAALVIDAERHGRPTRKRPLKGN